jgi:hypothetical protein
MHFVELSISLNNFILQMVWWDWFGICHIVDSPTTSHRGTDMNVQ